MGSVPESEDAPSSSKIHRENLTAALNEKLFRYAQNHPASKVNHDEACKYMPGGNTRTVLHVSPFPLTMRSGESCHLTTIDGHTYIDFLGEYTAGVYGHNNSNIKRAIEEALANGWNYGSHSLMEQRFAKTVCERFPAMDLVRFVNSGTEANMMALATAVAYTRRSVILIFFKGYHGGTISGKVYPGKLNINLPHNFMLGRYNDIQSTRSFVDAAKDDLAAILVEPMLGSGGCFPAKPEFLHLLRDLATQTGALLIFDEVMTSRLGYHGLGHVHGITPDIMTVGKWVGGGMTFGAFGGRREIMQIYDPRTSEIEHPGTFNNNVFTMSAGIAGCALLDENRLRELNALGDDMRSSLQKIFLRYQIEGLLPDAPLFDDQHLPGWETRPPKMFVTGAGSMMNIHFGGPDRTLLQGLYFHHMLESDIYMAQRGFVALSIEIKQFHVDKFLQATDQFCQQMGSALKW